MLKFYKYLFVLMLLVSINSYSEDYGVIEGVYKDKINIYNAQGKHLRLINSSEILIDTEIEIDEILENGLIRIKHKGNNIWLRMSALKLSQPVNGPCPDRYPSKDSDYTMPASSGYGGICDE